MSPAQTGHNQTIARKDLEGFLKRVEKILEEKKGLSDDIREIKSEVKAKGYDIKTFNECLKLRAMDSEKRQEQEDMRDMYISALGLC